MEDEAKVEGADKVDRALMVDADMVAAAVDGDGSARHRTEEEIEREESECGLGLSKGSARGQVGRREGSDGRHGHAASPLYSTEVGERPVVGLGCTVHTGQSAQQALSYLPFL